jgi:hypothetical protein
VGDNNGNEGEILEGKSKLKVNYLKDELCELLITVEDNCSKLAVVLQIHLKFKSRF